MKEIVADKSLVGYCGLYCGACRKYLTEKCPGCQENEAASWCKVRKCCEENNYLSCADCKDFSNSDECKNFNNFISKIFGFIFRSNRKGCINLIKKKGYADYAKEMAEEEKMTVKR